MYTGGLLFTSKEAFGVTWQEVATQYVIDRIQGANYDTDREYIRALVKIEAYVLRGGPQSFAEAVVWRELCRRYPGDVSRIQKELNPQNATDPTRFEQRERRPDGAHPAKADPPVRASAKERAWAKWSNQP